MLQSIQWLLQNRFISMDHHLFNHKPHEFKHISIERMRFLHVDIVRQMQVKINSKCKYNGKLICRPIFENRFRPLKMCVCVYQAIGNATV